MLGKLRFYCRDDKMFLDRRNVTFDAWEQKYYCKFCGSPVIQCNKVMKDMLEDYIEYLRMHKNTDFYE